MSRHHPLCKLVLGVGHSFSVQKRIARKISNSLPAHFSEFLPWSGPPLEDVSKMPAELSVLKNAWKIRVNQLRFIRVGYKPASKECIREFEVVDTLNDNEKLLFIRLHHAEKVEKYEMTTFAYSPENGGSETGSCLIKMLLERNFSLRSTPAKIYSPPERLIAYMYHLEGVFPTVIIEDGQAIKCLYQLHTAKVHDDSKNARIYSAKGTVRLGHFRRLTEGYTRWETMLYLKLHPEMDIMSKSILIGAALFTMTYVR